MTRPGAVELRRLVAEVRRPLRPDELDPAWTEEVEPPIELDTLPERVNTWDPSPQAEGDLAVLLHRELRLPRRVAADPRVWPWLAAVAFGEYTFRRWGRADGGGVRSHRLGGDQAKNAIARMWWIAETTRTSNAPDVLRVLGLHVDGPEDPYAVTRAVFEKQTFVHEFVNYTRVFTRTLAPAFLSLHQSFRRQGRHRSVKPLLAAAGLLFSSVSLDAFEGSPTAPDAVDLGAVVRLRDFLIEHLGAVPAP